MNSNTPPASNGVPAYTNPLSMQANTHGMQIPWSAMMPQQPNLAPLPSWSLPHDQASLLQQAQNMAGYNNMAFFAPQILQDAIRMSAPVGSSSNDDVLLAQVLHDSTKNGYTYKKAIESLHGVNNHASSLWKDYYLDHKPRIDELVANLSNPVAKTAKKPSFHELSPARPLSYGKRHTSSPSIASSHEKRRVSSQPRDPSRRHALNKTSQRQTKSENRRKTINSLTTFAPVFNSNLPPPHPDIQVPPAPSRSPTPPTEVIPGKSGNRYTDADKTYFIKFLSWRLKGDPSLTKKEICEMLSQKAPHHTQTSWTSHWHSRHDLADKILAAARNEETCESTTDDSSSDVDAEGTVDDDEEPITTHGYKRQADPDNDSDSSDSASEEALTSEESVDSSEDEKQMGEGGDALTKADMRFMAKHIAASQDREAAGGNDGWLLFSKRFPWRSAKVWAHHYNRCQKKIIRLARKYAQQKNKSHTQRSKRGRAVSKRELNSKRKNSRDSDGDYVQRKRARSASESAEDDDS